MKVVAGVHRMVLAAGPRRSSSFVFRWLLLAVGIARFLVGCKTCCRFALLELPETNAVAELIDDAIEIRDLV